ncbi:MAG: biotin/lipoyl-containing protein, partial [Candidatus Limnocylindrales bacterium]
AETVHFVGWLKSVGDSVVLDDAIAEIETEKATVEINALDAGTLVETLATDGSDIPVGDVIGYLDDGR